MTRHEMFNLVRSLLTRLGETESDSATLADVVVDAAYILARLNADGSGRSPADYVIGWTRKPQPEGATS